MSESILINWEIKSKERAKVYKDFLAKANKNAVLKALPDLHEFWWPSFLEQVQAVMPNANTHPTPGPARMSGSGLRR